MPPPPASPCTAPAWRRWGKSKRVQSTDYGVQIAKCGLSHPSPYSVLCNPYSVLCNPYSVLRNPYSTLPLTYHSATGRPGGRQRPRRRPRLLGN
ncbi:MAG: hypothetical protein EBR62_04740 [Verrucomicrobia bacterium]|nr:hypothetical protein [Verrucomicrobiota bacterium]